MATSNTFLFSFFFFPFTYGVRLWHIYFQKNPLHPWQSILYFSKFRGKEKKTLYWAATDSLTMQRSSLKARPFTEGDGRARTRSHVPRAVTTIGTYPPVGGGGRGRFFHCLITSGPMVYETWRSHRRFRSSCFVYPQNPKNRWFRVFEKNTLRIKEPLGFTKEPEIFYAAFDFAPHKLRTLVGDILKSGLFYFILFLYIYIFIYI
jgi:hypothetical protein